MGTTTTIPNETTNATQTSALATSSEVTTSVRITYDTGEVEKDTSNPVLDAVVVNEDQAKDKDGKPLAEGGDITLKIKGKNETFKIVAVEPQSAVVWKANSLDGINELCPNDEEVCNMFNRGISVKQANKFRSLLLEKDDNGKFVWEFAATPVDLKPYIGEVTNRRLSPTEKIMQTVSSMPPEQIEQIMAALAKLKGAGA